MKSKADALADAVRAFLFNPKWNVRDVLENALIAYDRSAPAQGERVRLAGWYRDDRDGPFEVHAGYDPDDRAWSECPEPDFFISVEIPPKPAIPEIEATVD